MLPNRTYNGLMESSFSQEELRSEAALRASMGVRRSRRANLQIGADKKLLLNIYRRARELKEEPGGALGALMADFHIVERTLLSLENLDGRRLPAMIHGVHTGLPRVYDIAACLVGHREGRVDEGAISRFLEAYQAVTPLTMREIAALHEVFSAALIKLLALECGMALEEAKSHEAAAAAAEQMSGKRRTAAMDRLDLAGNPAFTERLYSMLSERDEREACAELNRRLKLADVDIEALCVQARQRRARARERAGNAIKSLRVLSAMDWQAAFERYSHTHRELHADLTYCRMDARSRAYYRAWVERLSSRLGAAETVVARQAVLLAQGKEGKEGEAGWYLCMEGQELMYNALRPDKRFKKRGEDEKLAAFVAFELVVTLLLVWLAATKGIAPLILSIIPSWTIAGCIGVRLWMARTPVRVIPRIERDELEDEGRTLVVIPSLITDEKALRSVMERMETHMLSTRLSGCVYAVLGDFKDAGEERLDGEGGLLKLASKLTGELNRKYPAETPLFYYLHRHRSYNRHDGSYMGWERKRGAICHLVRLIADGDTAPFSLITSPLPGGIRYCITLDSDTILPPGAAAELIGCMEHPLNKPVWDSVVREGYGVIAPSMRSTATGAAKSLFAKLASGDAGVDGYFPTAPEFYQDVFGCGLFGGKGIFHVEAFRDTVMKWIPENTVLSHDMLEGCFLHGGYAGDIALYDSEPSSFIAWWKRQHRWLRGDWQLLPFLMDGIRDAGGVKRDNPLSWLSRRKILDNMRRSLLLGDLLYTSVLTPFIGYGYHILLGLLALWDGFAADILLLPFRFMASRNASLPGMAKDLAWPGLRSLMDIAALPYAAGRSGDAMRRTLYRIFVTRRGMLEWQTAAQTQSKPRGINGYYGALYRNPLFGILMAAGAIMGKTPAFAWTLAAVWIAMPALVWVLDRPAKKRAVPEQERELLLSVARGTWEYFDTFANSSTGYLPPDNFQQYPERKPALNTSPTNIGMGIMACISARELGLIGWEEAEERISNTADTLKRMRKWHGHLYNWYRTDTLEVLSPRYVSTVDSGNLAASLLTAAQALREAGREALAGELDGLARAMDFTALYDGRRRLFSIGYDGDGCELSRSWYDLLASEARLTSLVAIGLGQIEARHWFSLGRPMAPVCGRALLSWSGTMFEYLMPVIFTGLVPDTLLHESCQNAVKAQRRYSGGQVWGISESGYYAFDRNMYYQYRAFGIQKLSLMSHKDAGRVISPYSTLLALMADPGAAMANLMALVSEGGMGLYGMYEAIDYTPSRIPAGSGHGRVQSYMAHHQGMGLCAIANHLCEGAIAGYFARVPEMRAVSILTQERIPPYGVAVKALQSSREVNRKAAGQPMRPRFAREELEVPETQLLTNGVYTAFITDSGLGFSKRGEVMLTRWRPDHLRGEGGIRLLVRCGGEAFDSAKAAEAALYPYKAEFNRRCGELATKAEVCVSTRRDAEIRRLAVTNMGGEEKQVSVGAFFDVCLSPQREDLAHPAFNKLRVEARLEKGMLLFSRQGRDKGESWLYAKLICGGEPVYMSDRLRIQPRGMTLEEAMAQPVEQGEVGQPVEPYAMARGELSVAPGSVAEAHLIVGYAKSMREALESCEEVENELHESFTLAEAHANSALAAANIECGKAELFERMAARLLLHIPQKSRSIAGEKGLEALWKHGVSGDRPVTLVEIGRVTQLRLMKSLAEFQSYMAQRQCACDLVVVGGYPAEYRNELKERLEGMLREGMGAGYIHLINGYELAPPDKEALRSAAMVEIDPSAGLNRQFAPKAAKAREVKEYSGAPHAPLEVERPELSFDNGTGGFGEEGEYVITLESGQKTPLPWCNVLANASFGSIVSESGGGHTYCRNSREHKLTPWYNAPAVDPIGEPILLTDLDSGECFSPFPGRLQRGRMVVRHGYGYSGFTSGEAGLEVELTVFVHAERPAKYSVLTLRNPGPDRRRIRALYGAEWVLGDQPRPEAICTWMDNGAVFARSAMAEEDGGYAYIAVVGAEAETSSDRAAILKYGWEAESLPERHGAGGSMSALRAVVELEPGEERRLTFILGEDTIDGARESMAADTSGALAEVKAVWRERLGRVQVHTSNPAFDELMNGRLLYQVWAARILARTGYYQCGGAYGFRDQLQDMLALLHSHPERVREHLLLSAARQFKAGDVLHWWHSPMRGVRTRISDDRLFLPYVLYEYLEATGDDEALREQVPYLEERPIPEGRRDLYGEMSPSGQTESLYAHCVRAVDSIGFGAHGLPLMGGGDWNDGMDMVGENGGESVWLGWFLMETLRRMEALAKRAGRPQDGKRFLERADELRKNLEEHGWDGAWYRRAYFGDGTPLGSHENGACAIDCVSQAWAAICGGGRAAEAADSMLAMLYDEQEGIVKLLSPPFEGPQEPEVGYISEYIPGVRENGGQYTHAAVWAAMACCRLNRPEQAMKLMDAINPINHTLTHAQVMKYKAEPYAMAGDVYSGRNAGRGGWSWYTGAAAWMYKVGLEEVLGIRRSGNRLTVKPCAPFDEYMVEYRYGGSLYILHIRGKGSGKAVLEDDGRVHRLDICLTD